MESATLDTSHSIRILCFFAALFCVALPGSASVKAVVIVAVWAWLCITRPMRISSILWFGSVTTAAIVGAEVAFLHGVAIADSANQLTRILIFFFVLAIAVYLASSDGISHTALDRLIVWIAVVSMGMKTVILALVLTGRFSLEAIQSTLGFETVTDSIGFGLQRLQFPSDIAIMFLLVCYTGGKRRVDLLFLFCATISVFLSFSRFLFVAYIVCLAIRFFRLRRLDTVTVSALAICAALIVAFSVALAGRFTGEGTQTSDSIRSEQIRHLSEEIGNHFILGKGIGSSAASYRRSETLPFSYEVQWYAMEMQLGSVGLAWFLMNVISATAVGIKSIRGALVFAAVLGLWLIGGFTNPFAISLGSAFGLGLLILTIKRDAKIAANIPATALT